MGGGDGFVVVAVVEEDAMNLLKGNLFERRGCLRSEVANNVYDEENRSLNAKSARSNDKLEDFSLPPCPALSNMSLLRSH